MSAPVFRVRCRSCGERFSEANVYSYASWLETMISGLCEVCFDALAGIPQHDEDEDGQQTDNPRPTSGS